MVLLNEIAKQRDNGALRRHGRDEAECAEDIARVPVHGGVEERGRCGIAVEDPVAVGPVHFTPDRIAIYILSIMYQSIHSDTGIKETKCSRLQQISKERIHGKGITRIQKS